MLVLHGVIKVLLPVTKNTGSLRTSVNRMGPCRLFVNCGKPGKCVAERHTHIILQVQNGTRLRDDKDNNS